jgi:AsmA protein
MRFLLKAFFTVATLAVFAIAAIAFLVPQDVVRDQAIALVKQQTGRDLTVRGETSFAFYPGIGVALDDVTLSNPPDMGGGPMLRMESLTLNLKLLPLLTRSVEVERFVLVRPVFDLRVDARGRRNWDFSNRRADAPATPGEAAVRQAVKAEKPAFIKAQAGGVGGGLVQNIHLGTMRIEEGVVLYANAINGASHRLDAVNVSLRQEALSAPLAAEGNLVWRGEKVDFEGEVGSPTALLRGGASAIGMAFQAPPAKATFKGQVVAGDAVSVEGDVTGDTPSVRDLADWAGNALPHGKGLGPAKFSGRVKFAGQVLTFTNAHFSLDGMNGQGNGSVSLKGAKPYLRAALALDKLDLNAYLGPAGSAPPPRRPSVTLPNPGELRPEADATPKEGQSLTDFIKQLDQDSPKPQVRAWSQRAIDFAALNAIDADLNVNTGALLYEKLKVSASAVSASLKNGVMTANLNKVALYGGSGTGRVTLNGARAVPALALAFDLKGMSALPFLKDWIDFKWISGRANLVVNLSGSGRTQQQMVASLQGNGSLRFADGAIEGINIPAMVRGLKQGQFGGWNSNERGKTDFSSLTGTFTMQNGVTSNRDLNLVGPLIRMTGEGSIDLPREQIDYALLPRLVASVEGQGSQKELGGLVIPLRIRGRLDNPKVEPDLKKIIEDPELAKDAINKVGKAVGKLKGKKITGEQVEQLLQGVLGGGQQQGGQPAQETAPQQQGQQEINAQDLLKQLFKKRN